MRRLNFLPLSSWFNRGFRFGTDLCLLQHAYRIINRRVRRSWFERLVRQLIAATVLDELQQSPCVQSTCGVIREFVLYSSASSRVILHRKTGTKCGNGMCMCSSWMNRVYRGVWSQEGLECAERTRKSKVSDYYMRWEWYPFSPKLKKYIVPTS